MEASPKVGLKALLMPDNCVLVLIDHQPFQLANVNSHEPTMVMNNVTALAKTANAFDVPTILTTATFTRAKDAAMRAATQNGANLHRGRASVIALRHRQIALATP